MTCHRFAKGVYCMGGPIIEHTYEGRVWRWEQHSYFGPWPVTRTGEPWKRAPGERSQFWRAYEDWAAKRGKT